VRVRVAGGNSVSGDGEGSRHGARWSEWQRPEFTGATRGAPIAARIRSCPEPGRSTRPPVALGFAQ
jgi:hypothetical protein